MRPALFCAVVGALAGACTASAADVQPPSDQFVFPTGLAVAPDDSLLFVANANSELRFDSGSVLALDLALVDQIADAWTASGAIPAHCNRDPDHTESLICDEAQFIKPNGAVRIGNFATDIAVQDTGNGTFRLVVPVRGDPSISWIDWDGSKLACGTAQGFALCDDAHRLSAIHDNPDVGLLPQEPFNAFVDAAGQYAVITHLTTGTITLLDSQIGKDVEIADVGLSPFLPDQNTGLTGATGVAGRTPNMPGDLIYVGSRSESRIQMYTVGRPINDALPFLIPGNFFFLSAVGGNAGQSSDTRGMRFSQDGSRMYLVNRDPPSLQVYDTAPAADGFPANSLVASADICRAASTLTVMDTGDGDRAYLTCFQDGQMYVIDPRDNATVDNIAVIGRGPYAIASAPTRKKVYVSNFLEDTVSVVDATPGSPTRNRVILRLGQPKPASETTDGTSGGTTSGSGT